MDDTTDGPLLHDELAIWEKFNSTPANVPTSSLSSALIQVARQYAGETAVRVGDCQLAYGDMYYQALHCARTLYCRGVRAGDRVGILAERRVNTYTIIYAVALMGACYVPVDADFNNYNAEILRNADVKLVVGSGPRIRPYATAPELVCYDSDELCRIDHGVAGEDLSQPVDDAQGLYVVHTSGTTGTPKGVCISRNSVLNLASWYISRHGVVAGDRLSQNAPLTFDPSVQQLFSAWLSGAAVHVVPDALRSEPFEFLEWLACSDITHLDIVTAHWVHLCSALGKSNRPLPHLRWAIVAGESMYSAQCEQWFRAVGPNCRLHNLYGPTEATVNATEFEVHRRHVTELSARRSTVPIGRPLPGYRLYVVDDRNELCPPGIDGEILIAGAGLAIGYLNDPARTSANFVEMSLQGQPRQRLYRTGDIGRLGGSVDAGFVLQFCGRRDRQIKVSGYRVDLLAVDAAASRCAGVDHAALVPRGQPADRLTCLYSGPARREQLRAHLDRELPAHVVIGDVIKLPMLPLTPTGKVDYRALTQIVADSDRAVIPQSQSSDAVETLIRRAWAAELDVVTVDPDDRFRTIGGSSLAAFRTVIQLRELGIDVRSADLLADLTAGECASRASARMKSIPTSVHTHDRVVWSDDLDVTRRALSDVWNASSQSSAGPAPLGPMTAAWLGRRQCPAATACVELKFDATFDPDALATALERTISVHRSLRVRWRARELFSGTDVDVVGAEAQVPVIHMPHDGDRLDSLRRIVSDAAAYGDGRARSVVAITDDGARMMLYLPHVLVDGAAMSVISQELMDRAQGIAPSVPMNVLLAVEDAKARFRRVDARFASSARVVWERFERLDAALAQKIAPHRGTRVHTLSIETPSIDEADVIAWLSATAACAVVDIFGVATAPVSFLRASPVPSGSPPPVANMLDAVPLLIDRTPDRSEQFKYTSELVQSADEGAEHWVALAVNSIAGVGSRWNHGGLPLVGTVRIQRVGTAFAIPGGVEILEPGPSRYDTSPWIELASNANEGCTRITVANLDNNTARALGRRLVETASEVISDRCGFGGITP